MSHWLTDSIKNSKSSLLPAFSIIKNILPLVEGVMDDYHTREKISHSGKRISPEMKSRVIFFFQSVIFLPECGHLP
jgi:hypothetical protein